MAERSNTSNPIDLLFGGMRKLGPGDDMHTLHVLRQLPKQQFQLVVDAGCGTGRQTMALAKGLGTLVHAIDSHDPFLEDLKRHAKQAGLGHRVHTHCMDMKAIPDVFHHIDLLWSEGAAYNIGFANALTTWRSAMQEEGFVVVSELSWLRDRVPDAAKQFFLSGYPGMQSVQQNREVAQATGYRVLTTHALPEHAWVEGFYDVLEPRARALVDHPDPSVRDFAAETLKEIEVFDRAEGSYGYVFYVLQRA